MKKLISTIFISMLLTTASTYAATCDSKANEIVNMFDELFAEVEELGQDGTREVNEETCDRITKSWEKSKKILILNNEYKERCDIDGVFDEDSEKFFSIMIGILGAANKSCQDELNGSF